MQPINLAQHTWNHRLRTISGHRNSLCACDHYPYSSEWITMNWAWLNLQWIGWKYKQQYKTQQNSAIEATKKKSNNVIGLTTTQNESIRQHKHIRAYYTHTRARAKWVVLDADLDFDFVHGKKFYTLFWWENR